MTYLSPLECVCCGMPLSNDPDAWNAAAWTYAATFEETRYPYCAGSTLCMHEAERFARLRA